MVEDGRPQGADTPPRFDAMREAQRYIAALQDEVDRLRAALASGGTAQSTDDELLRIACVARNDGHEQHAVARWGEELAPVVTALRDALAARTPQPAPTDEPHCRLCGRFRSPWHDADGPRMRDPHPFTPAPDGEETP